VTGKKKVRLSFVEVLIAVRSYMTSKAMGRTLAGRQRTYAQCPLLKIGAVPTGEVTAPASFGR